MTGAGAVIACVVIFASWFLGRPVAIGLFSMVVAGLAFVVQPLFPGFFNFFHGMAVAYHAALQQENYWLAFIGKWLSFTLDSEAWLRVLPLGALCGGLVSIFSAERRDGI
jgi:hypothetical protein